MTNCECGCGNPAPIATRNNKRFGWVKGQPKRFIHNHHARGINNPNFNGGLCFYQGRWHIRCKDNSYVLYARAVAETKLRRKLRENEVVHHIDGDKLNDAASNLQVFPNQSEHMKVHRKYSDEDLLNKIFELMEKVGRTPTTTDLEKEIGMPTRETYRLRFGGFTKAKEEAFRRRELNEI